MKNYIKLKAQLQEAIDEHGRNHVELWHTGFCGETGNQYYGRYYDESSGAAIDEITDRIGGRNITTEMAVRLSDELRIAYCI